MDTCLPTLENFDWDAADSIPLDELSEAYQDDYNRND